MPVERIKFERTGGFAGMRIATDLEPDDLTDDQAQTLAGLLDDLDFRELPENIIGKAGMPDQFTYSITVETEEWKHTVVTGDASAEEKLQELLQLLNRLARKKLRQKSSSA